MVIGRLVNRVIVMICFLLIGRVCRFRMNDLMFHVLLLLMILIVLIARRRLMARLNLVYVVSMVLKIVFRLLDLLTKFILMCL